MTGHRRGGSRLPGDLVDAPSGPRGRHQPSGLIQAFRADDPPRRSRGPRPLRHRIGRYRRPERMAPSMLGARKTGLAPLTPGEETHLIQGIVAPHIRMGFAKVRLDAASRPSVPPAQTSMTRVAGSGWNSWASTGLEDASNFLLGKAACAHSDGDRERLEPVRRRRRRHACGACWRSASARTTISTSCSSRRNIRARISGGKLLAFTRAHLPDEIWLRCVRETIRRHGAGMSARVLHSRRNRSSR